MDILRIIFLFPFLCAREATSLALGKGGLSAALPLPCFSWLVKINMREQMANILIIDDQKWIINLCKEGLASEGYSFATTDDIESVRKNVFSFKPDIVLLNLYLKHGFVVWDVLEDIKRQEPNLPVLIVTAYDTYLYDPRLSRADGYVIKSYIAINDLKQKIATLISRKSASLVTVKTLPSK